MKSLWKPYATVIERSPSKSCPSDPIPTKTLKSYLNEPLPVITTLVNSSLQEGVFPDALKEGLLYPRIKKTSMDKENLNNFRPITNLAFLSKVIERTAACQTRHYLTENNLYPKIQAAYQQFQSTETALLRVHNDILRALDDKSEVILVLLDLSAAFDTIDHEILVARLRTQFGFTGKVLEWFTSYLQDRCQRVVIGNAKSGSKQPSLWSPQRILFWGHCYSFYTSHLLKIWSDHMALIACCLLMTRSSTSQWSQPRDASP